MFKPPGFAICEEFFQELLPLEGSIEKLQDQMLLLPEPQLNEGTNLVKRDEFRSWIKSQTSGLLWIDGYHTLHRRSWTTDFALNVLRAATTNRFATLHYFGSLHTDEPEARSLVQTLEFNMLQSSPAILSKGGPDLFNTEIFLAAKPSLDLSWRIFC